MLIAALSIIIKYWDKCMSINMSSKFDSKIPNTNSKGIHNMSPIAITRKKKSKYKRTIHLILNSLEKTFWELLNQRNSRNNPKRWYLTYSKMILNSISSVITSESYLLGTMAQICCKNWFWEIKIFHLYITKNKARSLMKQEQFVTNQFNSQYILNPRFESCYCR